MMKYWKFFLFVIAGSVVLNSCTHGVKNKAKDENTSSKPNDSTQHVLFPGEKHLSNVRQLTFGGDNAEAYWSFDGDKICFQRTDHQFIGTCDQIYYGFAFWRQRSMLNCTVVPLTNDTVFQYDLVSTGKGRTTCSYFLPGDSLILYASTHGSMDSCPPEPDKKKIGKYIWSLYDSYEIYVSHLNGTIKTQLTENNFYDAEATVSPMGDKIIFTSTRSGDVDLYEMNLDGSNVKQITHELGYDGGAWFSPDGKKIVWRASRPKTPEQRSEYKELLHEGLVAPTRMQVYIANADGSNAHQVTDLPEANWAPCFNHEGTKILFASNSKYDRGFPFDLFLINVDGTGLEQVTFSNTFDAFPMFSPDGKHLMWCSNRNNGGGHSTNIFIADWKD